MFFSLVRRVDNLFFGRYKDHDLEVLARELADQESVLDVACGKLSPVGRISRRPMYSVGVDAFQPSIDASRAAGFHDHYILADVRSLAGVIPEKSFDCVVALDFIEHLEKEDSRKLIDDLERIARKKVVLMTPNGFVRQDAHSGNPFQEHRCGWSVAELTSLGYRVTGLNGLKWLRGTGAHLRLKPEVISWRVSLLTEYFTTSRPELAFALFCVKNL